MTYRLSSGGLPDEKRTKLLYILSKVGSIADKDALCELLDIPRRRLGAFMQTKAAIDAMAQATDLTRLEYYNRLKEFAIDGGDEERDETEEDSQDLPFDTGNRLVKKLQPESISSHLPLSSPSLAHLGRGGYRVGDAREVERYTRPKKEFKSEKEWMRDQGCDLSDAEIEKWNKLADGK